MNEVFSVAEAEKQLTVEKARLAASSERCKELETFISLGKRLAGTSSLRSKASAVSAESTRRKQAKTLKSKQPIPIRAQGKDRCANATIALKTINRPSTVPEIIAVMKQQGTPINGGNPRQNLRSLLRARVDVFKKVGPALYGLKEWPGEQKQA